jgi:GntR family transcriptional regulator
MSDKVDPKIFSINAQSATPLYYQIKQNLRELVDAGTLEPDQLLPSEAELGQCYGVSRLTVRQAVVELVREGILRRERGVGTFVASPKLTQSIARAAGFSERVREAGKQPSSRVLSFEVIQAPARITHQLGLTTNARVYKLARVRCSDGEPVMLETAYLSQAQFPGLEEIDFSQASLYSTLADKFDCQIVEADETFEPVIMTDYEVQVLEARPNTPGLLVELVSFDQHGKPAEYSKSIVRGDKSRYLFHVRRQIWPQQEYRYEWTSEASRVG